MGKTNYADAIKNFVKVTPNENLKAGRHSTGTLVRETFVEKEMMDANDVLIHMKERVRIYEDENGQQYRVISRWKNGEYYKSTTLKFTSGSALDNSFNSLMERLRLNGGDRGRINELTELWNNLSKSEKGYVFASYHDWYAPASLSSDAVVTIDGLTAKDYLDALEEIITNGTKAFRDAQIDATRTSGF